MPHETSIEMLAFNLKMLGRKTKKTVLISAGSLRSKEDLLPHIRKLAPLNVRLFATGGTSKFLAEHGIHNERIYKITEKKEPNIRSFLDEDRFDLVINILTGDVDYDETSDSKLIRALAIENMIPLLTDLETAKLTIDNLLRQHENPPVPKAESWNLKNEFFNLVAQHGGFACHHAHFDKAYLISLENLKLGQVEMQKKWDLYKSLKENYTHGDLVERISRGVEMMIRQGARYCRTLVDADNTVKLMPVQAALEVKQRYQSQIQLEIGTQPLEGVVDTSARRNFVKACELADYIGGLPSRDRPLPERHLDILMSIAKDLNKRIDVHVDQENNPDETETEMLALKTIEHGLEGRVNAVHAISVAAKPPHEQEKILRRVKEAELGVIVCPSAALSMKQLDKLAPLHNSIAPLQKLLEHHIRVYIGVDNVYDLFMPFADGDIWTECRMLMEACRFYDIEMVARLACRRPDEAVQPQKINNAERVAV